jgi:arylsulfatase A-like enzyme
MNRTLRSTAAGALAGAAVSLALWAWDLLSIGSLRLAGVQAEDVERAVRETASLALVGLEFKLATIHLVLGLLAGGLAASAWGTALRERRPGIGETGLVGGFVTLTLHLLSLGGMVAKYPQLYADRAWLVGGIRATAQRVVTHDMGPAVFDCAFVALSCGVLVTLALAAARAWQRRPVPMPSRTRVTTLVLLVTAALAGAALGAFHRAPRQHHADDVNLLIIGVDSLRTDRLESSEVMPFTSSLRARGTLFRYAFTPIARTFPSWVATLTGTEPRHNGVRHMFPRREDRIDVGPTLFSELRDAGYRTFVVGDFAADVFPRFPGGFEETDAPGFDVDRLARATTLSAHRWSLPLLRSGLLRELLPEWRNLPSLADPAWLAERTVRQLDRATKRPFAGLVFFGTAHFPFVPPYPYFLRDARDYHGRYLYHVPPTDVTTETTAEDVAQIRHRYDGALRATDTAIQQLIDYLARADLLENTLVVVTSDHGEELLETPGLFGHGDTIGVGRSQSVPILLLGPRVPAGHTHDAQVRLYDLPATILPLLKQPWDTNVFGDGLSLFAKGPRPICVETGIWFWPTFPPALRGQRLTYAPISGLVEVDAQTREIVLRREDVASVETYKERGLVWDNLLWRERLTPSGRTTEVAVVPGVEPPSEAHDLRRAFEERCVDGDPSLRRFMGAIVHRPQAGSEPPG